MSTAARAEARREYLARTPDDLCVNCHCQASGHEYGPCMCGECPQYVSPCDQCKGSGDVPDVSPAGVVNWRYGLDCGACDGTGAEKD